MSKQFDVSVILVGDELLRGDRQDAHLRYISSELLRHSIRVGGSHVVADDRHEIGELLSGCLDRSRVVIVCGGLGPTHDDVTREGVADGLGMPLEFREDQWQWIQNVFRQFQRAADESNRRQAYFPAGAEPIPNLKGTAPGFFVEKGDALVVVLPGPPRELHAMFHLVLARLETVFAGRAKLYKETFRTTGIGESAMTSAVQPVFDEVADVCAVASLPHVGGVDIIVTQHTHVTDNALVDRKVRSFEQSLRSLLAEKLYAKGEVTLEQVIGERLIERGETLAVAESLTGGYLGKRITDNAGSSRYLLADIVAYSNDAKVRILGVSQETLDERGAVSELVCLEMAEGAIAKTGATYALATTGIAGPGGGSKQKPVGLTYYGLARKDGAVVKHAVFPGDRHAVRRRVAFATMLLLHERLTRG